MNGQNPYDYRHETMRDYFAQKAQNEVLCLNKTKYYSPTMAELENWLNNYTTLLNAWFCELLYFPTATDNEYWAIEIYNKIESETHMAIQDILAHFHIKSMRFDGVNMYGVSEFAQHLDFYLGLCHMGTEQDVRRLTYRDYRTHITKIILPEICKNNKSKLIEELKDKYPRDVKLPFNEGIASSYHMIVRNENNREHQIIAQLINYDHETIRPLLMKLGFVEAD